MIKKIPLAMSGIILPLAILSNLFLIHNNIIAYSFLVASFLSYISIFLRILKTSDEVSKEFDNPNLFAFFSTFSMSTMFMGSAFYEISPKIAYYIWFFGLVFHGLMIISFVMKFLKEINLKNAYPSWFLLFSGISSASITGIPFEKMVIAQRCLLFGTVSFIILLPFIFYKVIIKNDIKETTMPTIALMSFPPSLLLAGYILNFENQNIMAIIILIILSAIMYIFTITQIPAILKSNANFISSIAISSAMIAYAFEIAKNTPLTEEYVFDLKYVVFLLTTLSVLTVILVVKKILSDIIKNNNFKSIK